MPAPSPSETAIHGAFPTATLVIGVGQMGQKILELLGERWSWIAQDNPDDPTLHHLRLLHLNPTRSPAWEHAERHERTLAQSEGDATEPDQVLDFLILRTIGLIRYRHGAWQIASPQDQGPIGLRANGFPLHAGDTASEDRSKQSHDERFIDTAGTTPVTSDGGDRRKRNYDELTTAGWRRVTGAIGQLIPLPPAVAQAREADDESSARNRPTNGIFAGHTTFRLRSYRWIHLAEDPREAAQNLRKNLRLDGELARFIEPLLARVRDGNSPRILLHALYRYNAWAKGMDPSPWTEPAITVEDDDADGISAVLRAYDEVLFRDRVQEARDDGQPLPTPPFFTRGSAPTLTSPLHPWTMLSLNWETPGWTFHDGELEQRIFRSLPGSADAFGFRDVDRRLEESAPNPGALQFQEDDWYRHLQQRIQSLHKDTERGLIRLWGHLTRLRQRQTDDGETDDVRTKTLHQSLDLLGQFIVRPVLNTEADDEALRPSNAHETPPTTRQKHSALPIAKWKRALNTRELANRDIAEDFDDYLREHGLLPPETTQAFTLAHEADIDLERVASAGLHSNEAHISLGDAALSDESIQTLRSWLNKNARELLSVRKLTELPRPPGDKRLEVRVYIVGDLGETATRVAAHPLLRFTHAELLRLVSPIYESSFDGHTRPLSITPILSFPHPADASGAEATGDNPVDAFNDSARRVSERVVIDAVHRLRRWIELIPPSEQLTHEILVNGRVTDRAILSVDDAAEEIRSFIWMNARNSLSSDQLLTTALNNRTNDVLATFSCRELAFPGERARTWASNRYARVLLHAFQNPADAASSPLALAHNESADGIHGRGESPARCSTDYAKTQIQEIEANFDAKAHEIENELKARPEVTWRDASADWLQDNLSNERMDEIIYNPLTHHWSHWASDESATMGAFSDEVLQSIHASSVRSLAASEKETRHLIESVCPQQGSGAMVRKIRKRKHDASSDTINVRRHLDNAERDAARHRQPNPREIISAAAETLRATVNDKPDYLPLALGTALAAFCAALIFGPFLQNFIIRPQSTSMTWGLQLLFEAITFAALAAVAIGVASLTMGRKLHAIRLARRDFEQAVIRSITDPKDPRAVVPYFTQRLRHRAQLARFGVKLHELAQATEDSRLIHRVHDASEARMRILRKNVEETGVKVTPPSGNDLPHETDDISGLFRGLQKHEWLASPTTLAQWYSHQAAPVSQAKRRENAIIARVEDDELTRRALQNYFRAYPIHENWRESAPFADGTLEQFSHDLGPSLSANGDLFQAPNWAALVGGSVFETEEIIREDAVDSIIRYAGKTFGTIGFGAKFRGREGMDDDGIETHNMLLLSRTLQFEIYEKIRERARQRRNNPHGVDPAEAYDVLLEKSQISIPQLRSHLQTNAVYYLMTALGIRERSFQNLKPFTTFHDHSRLPEREQFPLSLSGVEAQGENLPMRYFSHQHLYELSARDSKQGEP